MDAKSFEKLTSKVSNETLAESMEMTAKILADISEGRDGLGLWPIVCTEAAKRLRAAKAVDNFDAKLLEDLTRRIYEAVTPETVALGAEKLRQKLVSVIAAN